MEESGFRYRPLPELLGARVGIDSVERAPEILEAFFLRGGFEASWRGPREDLLHRSIARFGLIDAWFTVDPSHLVHADTLSGRQVIEELYLRSTGVPSDVEPPAAGGSSSSGAYILAVLDGLKEVSPCLRVLLETDHPHTSRLAWTEDDLGWPIRGEIPSGFLPRVFTVSDACVTNSSGLWMQKLLIITGSSRAWLRPRWSSPRER